MARADAPPRVRADGDPPGAPDGVRGSAPPADPVRPPGREPRDAAPPLPTRTRDARGDADLNGTVDIADPIGVLGHLFFGMDVPPCMDAADSTDDGTIDISDAVATLGALFLGTEALPPPTGAPGEDPTPDGLTCDG